MPPRHLDRTSFNNRFGDTGVTVDLMFALH